MSKSSVGLGLVGLACALHVPRRDEWDEEKRWEALQLQEAEARQAAGLLACHDVMHDFFYSPISTAWMKKASPARASACTRIKAHPEPWPWVSSTLSFSDTSGIWPKLLAF